MKIAVLGDIHSNHLALEACLARIEELHIRHLVFLGDYISDCAFPEKTLSLLRAAQTAYSTAFIRGNRENYMLSHHVRPHSGWVRGSRCGSLLYTYNHLTEADLAWFDQMPISMQTAYGESPAFTICHGSPEQERCMLLPETDEMTHVLGQLETDLLLCAHTHTPFIHHWSNRTVVNGGTVGLPENGIPEAQFATVEYRNGGWIPELHHVPYDIEGAVREIHTSGLAEWANVWAKAIIKSLRTAESYAIRCLRLVEQIKAEHPAPPDDEACWAYAAQQLDL